MKLEIRRKNEAIRNLMRLTYARIEREEDEAISPAESLMLDAIITFKDWSQKYQVTKAESKTYRRMKRISEVLGLFPIPKEVEDAYMIRRKMEMPYGALRRERSHKKHQFHWVIRECER